MMINPLLAVALAAAPSTTRPVTVAAVLYTGDEREESGCEDDAVCIVERLVRQAAWSGAELVVVSEYAFDHDEPELEARRYQAPRDTERMPLQVHFSRLAAELGLFLVLDLGTEDEHHRYNTQVAFDPRGVVVAVHHKFELYESEEDDIMPGEGVTTFATPFGRVGLLICSDLYGDPGFHRALTQRHRADIVALSSIWTVEGAMRWQAAFARDWGVHLVAANGATGEGEGAGIYDASGQVVAGDDTGFDGVIVATIDPRRGS